MERRIKQERGEGLTKNKPKFYNKLFFKVYMNYAMLLVLFAALLGFIYLNQYKNVYVEEFKEEKINQAINVSNKMNEYVKGMDYSNVREQIATYADLVGGDVWIIQNINAAVPLSDDLTTLDITDPGLNLAQGMLRVIYNALEGQPPITETYYSDMHGGTIISTAVHISGVNGEICGAVVINVDYPFSGEDEVTARSFSMVLASSLIAAGISIIIAVIFARNLTSPILRMRNTALKLSEGRYETKTGINRNDEIGELAGTIDFLTDKLQENEEIRKSLDQMRLDFFANVSHELRTPITVVRAYTESLVDGVVSDGDKIGQYYERMLAECISMERLVGDLLLLSKMQNPDFEIDVEPVNISQIFDEIVRGIRVLSEEKNISINVGKDGDVYMMYGDYDRLRQMFLVIIDNAIKFSPDNSTIFIRIRQEDKILVSIRDEGIGITDEEKAFIFEKFYRSKLKQNAKGSGLGLSIARQIALKHNGDIEVISEQGIGTEFIFSFEYIKDRSVYM